MPFYERRDELAVHDCCLLWGTRVVVPSVHRKSVLIQLHEGHPGITRMKGLSRMYVWWPGICKDIEEAVGECYQCQQHQSSPPVAPLHPWSWPTSPWARVHIDYAGPIEGHMILVIVDAHSKWIKAIPTSGSTSRVVLEELRFLFSQFGLPECIVSDNGTCFTSQEFKAFLQRHGVNHITSAPYHPASNGLAERAVQVVKKGLRKVTRGSMRTRIATILFNYRLTVQTTTGVAPSELMLGRRPRCHLDLLKPNTADRVERKQAKQAQKHNAHARDRHFAVGERVYVRNYQQGRSWLPGVIQERTGPVSFRVRMQDGRIRRCHLDQVRKRSVEEPSASESEIEVPNSLTDVQPVPPDSPVERTQAEESSVPHEHPVVESSEQTSSSSTISRPATAVKVYPTRTRKAVDRFEPTWN